MAGQVCKTGEWTVRSQELLFKRCAQKRLRRAILPLSLLLLLLLYVHACMPKRITDLRVVSVSRVPASALPQGIDLSHTVMEREEAFWKVALAGGAQWVREVTRHELNSYAAVRCDLPDYRLLSLGPYVGAVEVTTQGDTIDRFEPLADTLQYDVYLPETARYSSEEHVNAPMPSYDLGSERVPLCLRIAGGAMHGAYNRSNEVRVEVGRRR